MLIFITWELANPKLWPSFVWVTYWWVQIRSGRVDSTADPLGKPMQKTWAFPWIPPCAGTPRALWLGEEQEHKKGVARIWSQFPAGDCHVLKGASNQFRLEKPHLFFAHRSWANLWSRRTEQCCTAQLGYIKVRGVKLFLIQKQQLKQEPVWHKGETLHVVPPLVPPFSLPLFPEAPRHGSPVVVTGVTPWSIWCTVTLMYDSEHMN